MQYKVYFSGPLFDHKDLAGNQLLASKIEECSGQVYSCVLPQDLVVDPDSPPSDVRNRNLHGIVNSDLCLFNFDGPDLDSGTVMEFVFAKIVDIPSVLLRTDFRASGDQPQDCDPWNLMCSFYPRSKTLIVKANEVYDQYASQADIKGLYTETAKRVVKALGDVRQQPAVMPQVLREMIYEWAILFPGHNLEGYVLGTPNIDNHL